MNIDRRSLRTTNIKNLNLDKNIDADIIKHINNTKNYDRKYCYTDGINKYEDINFIKNGNDCNKQKKLSNCRKSVYKQKVNGKDTYYYCRSYTPLNIFTRCKNSSRNGKKGICIDQNEVKKVDPENLGLPDTPNPDPVQRLISEQLEKTTTKSPTELKHQLIENAISTSNNYTPEQRRELMKRLSTLKENDLLEQATSEIEHDRDIAERIKNLQKFSQSREEEQDKEIAKRIANIRKTSSSTKKKGGSYYKKSRKHKISTNYKKSRKHIKFRKHKKSKKYN
uniref:Uncharacterized protein n=1 Tax=Nucleocytoviricota sp. TaxID=2809609 RepID=A0A9E8GBB7_9VIRU|nr:hypothetical protein [Nucleocytoviricota sp.]UZT29225.1 hypothetical protein [Nucleocytoviricota sp.]